MASPKSKQPKQARSPSALASQIASKWGRGDVALDRLVSELGDVQRYDIVAALKELEKLGAGELEVGRAGKKAHFVWKASRVQAAADKGVRRAAKKPAQVEKKVTGPKAAGKLAKAKLGGAAGPLPVAPARAALAAPSPSVGTKLRAAVQSANRASTKPVLSGGDSLEHSFHLRPGFSASIRLPSDVSRLEMERFCQFLSAIPFAQTKP